MLKVIGIVLVVALLVLVGMNFLVVSNTGDRLRALQADVDELKMRVGSGSGAGAPAAAGIPFDVETQTPISGETPAADGPLVVLSDRPVVEATVALVETIAGDGTRTPVVASAVVLLPGVTGMIPIGRESGCVATIAGGGAWIVTLDGGNLRIASRGCAYPRPLRGRLRGLLRH
jgi:hypothetical protein